MESICQAMVIANILNFLPVPLNPLFYLIAYRHNGDQIGSFVNIGTNCYM